MQHQRLRSDVVDIARTMSEKGLVSTTSGNVSARTSDGHVLITPSGLDYSTLEPEHIVLVTLEGTVMKGDLEPSSELVMHTEVYRARPEVGGIVHSHAPYATTLACMQMDIPPVHYLLAALSEEGRVPLAGYAPYGTPALATLAHDALGEDHAACLLQNHGTLAVGKDVGQAYAFTEILEEMAEIYYRTLAVGKAPALLSDEDIRTVREKMKGYGPYTQRPDDG